MANNNDPRKDLRPGGIFHLLLSINLIIVTELVNYGAAAGAAAAGGRDARRETQGG